jgi:hypothetical protein
MNPTNATAVRDEASRIIVDELLQSIQGDLPHIRRHASIEDDVESLRRLTDEFGSAVARFRDATAKREPPRWLVTVHQLLEALHQNAYVRFLAGGPAKTH